MPSPNPRRDKALEDIARELRETNKHLKRIAENGRSLKFRNKPAVPPDPFDPALLTEPTGGVVSSEAGMNGEEGPHSRACGFRKHDHGPECHENCPTCHGKTDPVFPKSDHPYFKRSQVSDSGPYGLKPPRAYE